MDDAVNGLSKQRNDMDQTMDQMMEQSMEQELFSYIGNISGPDEGAMECARKRQEILAKPPGSLGKLEEISVRLAGITGQPGRALNKRRIIVLCADNGVVKEGVSSAPASVTAKQAVNMTRGTTGMACLAREFGCGVQVVDVGIGTPYVCSDVLDRKIRPGTDNIAEGPAMTRMEAVQAVLTGIRLVKEAKCDGVDAIGVGEMGIGNTTTSAAVLSAFLGSSPESLAGRGGGLTDEAFERKKKVLSRALSVNRPDPSDPLDVLSKVGGFDLAAMAGVFLGCAGERIPAVADGFISSVAALAAVRLCPNARASLFPSHASAEPGHAAVMKALGLEPWLDLGMRLGEGSGCVLAFEILRAAQAAIRDMATFEEASIDDTYLQPVREEEKRAAKAAVQAAGADAETKEGETAWQKP